MYDAFSADYDRFVNWESRLAFELPFLIQLLNPQSRVLDAACGTGQHAIALARRGFPVAGADLSPGMVERAKTNAALVGMDVPFVTAGFGQLATAFGGSPLYPFDAVLCLGNSLPHLLSPAELAAALADFAACLQPGGRLVIQSRNFDAVLAQHERWMEPQSLREGQREWIFIRFYDFDPDGLITFNILTLSREGSAPWQQRLTATRLHPQSQTELSTALSAAGFSEVKACGSLSGAPFDPATSGNLVMVCRK